MLVKRRSRVPFGDLARLSDPAAGEWAGWWLQRRIAARRLLPICQVSYSRTARGIDTPAGPARLTIDEALSASPIDRIGFTAEPGRAFLDGRRIVELKFRSTLPAIFKRLIEEMVLAPGTVSKYRLGISALGRVPDDRAAGDPLANGGSVRLQTTEPRSAGPDAAEAVLVEADHQPRLARNV